MENLSGFQILELPKSDEQTPFNLKKRVCKKIRCKTILTSFNLGLYCHLHKPLALLAQREYFVRRTSASKSDRKE